MKGPHDVALRIKLLQLLVEEGKIDEAKDHAFNAEAAVAFHTGMILSVYFRLSFPLLLTRVRNFGLIGCHIYSIRVSF